MKTIRKFKHINAKTIDDAVSVLRQYGEKAFVIAGGTDLIGTMRFDILPDYPEAVINLRTIPGLDYIKEENGVLKIGALTRLEDIAVNSTVKNTYTALFEAAGNAASPHIREMGTIVGNICQLNRCWYFRKEENRFDCARKGGGICNAMIGDNRYHSIFGAMRISAAPCSSGCKASVNIPSCLSKIREDKLPEAAEIMLQYNPLPSITGRVCPHFCEQNCSRNEYDEPVSFRSIERYLGDYILENTDRFFKFPRSENKKSVAVIGAGPAGLSAAYYLRRIGYRVIVFEAMKELGGILTYGIPPYRLPKAVVRRQIEALQKTGIQFKPDTRVGKDIKIDELTKNFDAVFLACGAWKQRLSGIKGKQFITSGLDFLVDSNTGVRKVPGKQIAVMGGGNAAVDIARTLLRLGSEPVIIYRRSRGEMPALKEEVDKALEEGIKIQFLTLPVEAAKSDNKIALKCTRMKLGPIDETGRPRPVIIKGSEFTTAFDAVIEAYGEEPDYSILSGKYLNDEGRLKVDPATYSLGDNIFTGGDFVSGPATVVQAICAGREAGLHIDEYLGGKGKKIEKSPGVKYPDKFSASYLEIKRVSIPELPVDKRILRLDVEDVGGLDINNVETEADRCFNCGCIAVNPSDMAPALIVLDAKIKTTRRVIEAEKLFTIKGIRTTALEDDEIVVEIQIPAPKSGTKCKFIKFAIRKSIDFPIVNCAAAIESERGIVQSARICLNAVYCSPYRATKAEDFIKGKPINEANAEAAGDIAISDAIALPYNKYKIQVAKTLVKRVILACK